MPGGLAQGRRVSGWLPLTPVFLTHGVFARHRELIFLAGTIQRCGISVLWRALKEVNILTRAVSPAPLQQTA